jgi:membrane dipeptidase
MHVPILLAVQTLAVDIHAHPSRFHRANVVRIETDEIARYRRAGIDAVVCNISTDTLYRGGYVTREGLEIPIENLRPEPGESWAFTLDRYERIEATAAAGEAVLARTPAEALEAKKLGKLALIAALEGADGLEGDLERLHELHDRGLALLQLVHFRANEIGHIQTWPYTPGGLTAFGREVVQEANRLGIILDLAHANPETIHDVLQASRHPVLFSHTGALALKKLDRHLGDTEMRAIAEGGGVIGIWPNGDALPQLSDMVDHIDYVKRLVGIDHVGIGSDLRGMSKYTEGFGEEARFEAIREALAARGYSPADIEKVMGGNFQRVWNEVARKGGSGW